MEWNPDEEIKDTASEVFFTETREPIMGRVVPNSEDYFLDISLRRRRLPRIGEDFKPNGEYYERWEVVIGNSSWFFPSKIEAELFIIDLRGKDERME